MWIVVINRPYYPSVDEFDTEDAARAHAANLNASEHSEDGAHAAKIYVAHVVTDVDIRTDY